MQLSLTPSSMLCSGAALRRDKAVAGFTAPRRDKSVSGFVTPKATTADYPAPRPAPAD